GPGGLVAAAGQGSGSRERQAQADVRGTGARQRSDEGPDRKKTVGPEQKREAVRYLIEVHARPLSRSCECVGLSRATWYQAPQHWTVRDAEIIAALAEQVESRPTRGFWKCCKVLPCSAGREPQANLPGVQGHEAQPASQGQAAAAQARTRAAVRPAPARHRLVGRLYGRCAGLWPSLPDLQRSRRLQPRGAARSEERR